MTVETPGRGAPSHSPDGPLRVLVQTVSLYFIGTIDRQAGKHPVNSAALLLREAIAITNTGRLDELLRTGEPTATFDGFVMPPGLPVRIEATAIIWSIPWVHAMPKFPGST